jgi:WD40 repeat protein
MIYANSKSGFERQLQGPIEGTDSVLSVGGRLAIASKNKYIYTWKWSDLSAWSVVAKLQAQIAIPTAKEKIVYIPSVSPTRLISTNIQGDKELSSLPLPYGAECNKIKTSSNGEFGVVSLLSKEGINASRIKLAMFNSDLKELTFVFEKDMKTENFSLSDFAISDDGNLLAGVGRKEKAWIFVKDIKNDKILWEKTFGEYDQFTIVRFSPDGRMLFVSEKVRFINSLDLASGNTIRIYEMLKYNTPAHQKQNVSCIAISPDGKILAADTEPAGNVWYWDISTGQEINHVHINDFTVSDIAFSPDSKYLAAGCLVSPEIKIWKVPQPQ